jgi:predicted deacylase
MPTTLTRRTMDLAGLDVPIVEATGASDGPKLTVIAGVHGCEYASMAAVRQWSAGLAGRDLRGRVTVVPVLNLPAYRARSPFVVPEDGKNLNRCFPGDAGGSLAERLAYATFTQLITGSDALIDAHCGDLPEALEPFTLYEAGPSEKKALEIAVAYGLGYVIRQEVGPGRAVGGTTSAAAAQAGIPAITAEAGGCGLIEQSAVDLHLRGLDRVLVTLGMDASAGTGRDAAAGNAPAAPTMLNQFIWLRSQADGWWQPAVGPGDSVAEGQLLGTVSTLDGIEVLQSIHAPTAGVPMFITSSPAVEADGLLLGLGAA